MDSPYEISRAPDELHYTYLDTFGRPVIVAHKSNLVEQHIQDIVVSITLSFPSSFDHSLKPTFVCAILQLKAKELLTCYNLRWPMPLLLLIF